MQINEINIKLKKPKHDVINNGVYVIMINGMMLLLRNDETFNASCIPIDI